MSTLEEIKAATAKLSPEEQVELFRWWTSSETFRTRQLAALKHELALGIDQLEQGKYRTYEDASLMQLAEEVGQVGRERLKDFRNTPST
ncbi:MAG TPA: hypothetical protein VEC99_15950 [Clostridia bacterium]|nr:hypothetical protein [Clostridia bacterium]